MSHSRRTAARGPHRDVRHNPHRCGVSATPSTDVPTTGIRAKRKPAHGQTDDYDGDDEERRGRARAVLEHRHETHAAVSRVGKPQLAGLDGAQKTTGSERLNCDVVRRACWLRGCGMIRELGKRPPDQLVATESELLRAREPLREGSTQFRIVADCGVSYSPMRGRP